MRLAAILLAALSAALCACSHPCPPRPRDVLLTGAVSWRNESVPPKDEFSPPGETRYVIVVDGVDHAVQGVAGPSWPRGESRPTGRVPARGTVKIHAPGGPTFFRPQDAWAEIVLSP